jgi:serine protease Do
MTLRMAQLSSISSRLALLVSFLVLCFAGTNDVAQAQSQMERMEGEIQEIFNRTKQSVVQIKTIVPVTDASKEKVITEGLSIGTGFFADKKGLIFTAASVLRGCTNAVVYWQGKSYEGKVIGQDARSNFALLTIETETPSLSLGDPDALKVGSASLAVGYPADGSVAVEYGNICNLDAAQLPQRFAITHIRSSIRAQPGQSGSPLLNSKGEAVGIITYSMLDGSSSFALPITAAQKIKNDFVKFGEARHGWTGLSISVQSAPSAEGIPIIDVQKDSPAALAGIQAQDILAKIGDKAIRTPTDVINATFYLSAGETVNFTILRDGEEKLIPVKVVPRPLENRALVTKPASSR